MVGGCGGVTEEKSPNVGWKLKIHLCTVQEVVEMFGEMRHYYFSFVFVISRSSILNRTFCEMCFHFLLKF